MECQLLLWLFFLNRLSVNGSASAPFGWHLCVCVCVSEVLQISNPWANLFPSINAFVLISDLIVIEIWIFAVFCCAISNTQPWSTRVQSAPADPPLHTLLAFPPENTRTLAAALTFPPFCRNTLHVCHVSSLVTHTLSVLIPQFSSSVVLFLPLHSLADPVQEIRLPMPRRGQIGFGSGSRLVIFSLFVELLCPTEGCLGFFLLWCLMSEMLLTWWLLPLSSCQQIPPPPTTTPPGPSPITPQQQSGLSGLLLTFLSLSVIHPATSHLLLCSSISLLQRFHSTHTHTHTLLFLTPSC